MKKAILFLCLGAICFTSCKKKEEEKSKSDILAEGKWKLTAANFNGIVDLMSSMKECQKDNLFLFNTNKTITLDEGATKCSDAAEQTRTDGNWELTNNDAKITVSNSSVTAGLGSLTGDIVKLDATSFQITKDTAYSGFSGKINITFTNVK